ncbi:16S rRNA (cytosine(1402)-N(4))-methyltransferase RsmH [Rhodococcus sp. ZPP]|uniref:16S rRNA (cytosine(1402)-N(4))-methyltransferase RsmH n=1 Tax=Rhodococcus sp. ZPP TaxID=2749906 RepID=UPI001AD89030|nr:16S rRNA (cytosine(1402)-N(4))-methyltransferase RsmH [Rhodococcus sp. ZPP]QTJ69608.1 16S rRNA (cytosine(1402)-N(4))-methyltransferase RsmH [Rhodococcus sp. ZPP]
MVDHEGEESSPADGFGHIPVLLHRAVELLGPALTLHDPEGGGAVMIDATLGLGGHSEHFLRTYPRLKLVALDRDPRALEIAGARLAPFGDRVTFVHTRYDGIENALLEAGLPPRDSVHGILFDLGVSSMQLDESDRGFAYSIDAPLDMRMDPTTGITAAEVLNTYSHGDLARILSTYGEERFAGKIASEIVRQRAKQPFTTSAELVELLYRAIPAATRRTGGHPAKRTFQALRVEVNGELDSLRAAIPAALDALTVGGRVVFMSYQSLEDRVVKQEITPRSKSRSPEGLPVELPGMGPEFRILTRGAERASEQEIEENPRSAPVRLRAAERIARRSAA